MTAVLFGMDNRRAMEATVTIYGLVQRGTTEIRYVGRTRKTPQERLTRHIWKARERGGSSTLYVSRWIRSCGYAVDAVVLEAGPEDPREAERSWIERLRREGARLTNLTHGGEGAPPRGFLLSLEQRAKISEANRRRFSDPAARQAIADANRRRGPEAIANMLAARRLTKFHHSDESKAKMSATRRGVPKSPQARANIAAANRARARSGAAPLGQLVLGGDAL